MLMKNLINLFFKLGDIWTLGRHRLICSDSTKEETYQSLMEEKKVNLVVTDSQYYRHLYLVSPYAATINNLSKEVEKTVDKTMKIIYTISGGNENESNN